MFDLSQVMDFLKVEPGHGLLQSGLLLLIWIESRGLRKDLSLLKAAFNQSKELVEQRFQKIEWRITAIENK